MTTVIIILAIWGIYRLLKGTAERRQAERAERERQRIREEQAAQRREQMEIREQMKLERIRAQEETKRIIALEREQARQAQEQIRQVKEQERQAAQLARHEEQIEKLQYAVEQNTRDIEFYTQRQAELYAQLDNLLLLQAGTVPGSTKHTQYQSKIVTLNNQIHSAECKLAKAEFLKAQAERKMA